MKAKRWKRALVITVLCLHILAIIGLVLSLTFNGAQALRLVLPILVVSISVGLIYWLPVIRELFRRTK
jgi:hypothetical protein